MRPIISAIEPDPNPLFLPSASLEASVPPQLPLVRGWKRLEGGWTLWFGFLSVVLEDGTVLGLMTAVVDVSSDGIP